MIIIIILTKNKTSRSFFGKKVNLGLLVKKTNIELDNAQPNYNCHLLKLSVFILEK
jgi:hypothetical protein